MGTDSSVAIAASAVAGYINVVVVIVVIIDVGKIVPAELN